MRVGFPLFAAFVLMLVPVRAFAQGYVCAEGGGTGSGPWSAEMFGWMVEKGNKGAAVILGAVELDATDKPDSREAALLKAGASSVKSLVITQANADSQEVHDAIAAASIVFIRGGSQSRYVEWWKGTKTEAAIRSVFAKGGVVGGTSAGCAILGEMSYDAVHGSLKPEEVVTNATHPDLTLTKGFLGLVPGVLFDTHFGERARLPRLMVMLGHCREFRRMEPLGIGLDPRTALCVSPDGTAEVKGEGYATVLELSAKSSVGLRFNEPPTVTHVHISIVPAGAKIDLAKRSFVNARVAVTPHAIFGDYANKEVAVTKRSVADSPASQMERSTPADGPTEPERPQAEWVEARRAHGSRPLWFVKDPYIQPRVTMDRLHSMVGEAMIAVLIAPGGLSTISNATLAFPGQAPTAGPSSVVLDTTRVQDKFMPGTFTKPAVHRATVHLLPSGYMLDLANGVLVQVPHPEKLPSTGR